MLTQFEREMFDLFNFGFNTDKGCSFTNTSSFFPPYAIKKFKCDKYVIELALAGYKKEDLEVKLEKNILTIKGKPSDTKEHGYEDTLESTIKRSKFTRSFTLQKGVEVCTSEFKDGLLKIHLNKFVPEEELPKTISIK